MDKDDLNGIGLIAGVIVWFGCVLIIAAQTRYSCPSSILTSILSVGMLAPAWLAAKIVSAVFPSRKK